MEKRHIGGNKNFKFKLKWKIIKEVEGGLYERLLEMEEESMLI